MVTVEDILFELGFDLNNRENEDYYDEDEEEDYS